MRRDQAPPTSNLPPPAVMRTAVGMMIPFAIVWAVAGSALWDVILSQYGTSLPTWAHAGEVGSLLMVVYAVFGAVFAVAVRVFFWMLFERRPRRAPVREVPTRDDIHVGQDWQEI